VTTAKWNARMAGIITVAVVTWVSIFFFVAKVSPHPQLCLCRAKKQTESEKKPNGNGYGGTLTFLCTLLTCALHSVCR